MGSSPTARTILFHASFSIEDQKIKRLKVLGCNLEDRMPWAHESRSGSLSLDEIQSDLWRPCNVFDSFDRLIWIISDHLICYRWCQNGCKAVIYRRSRELNSLIYRYISGVFVFTSLMFSDLQFDIILIFASNHTVF